MLRYGIGYNQLFISDLYYKTYLDRFITLPHRPVYQILALQTLHYQFQAFLYIQYIISPYVETRRVEFSFLSFFLSVLFFCLLVFCVVNTQL